MSVAAVRAFLAPFGLSDRIRTFDVSSATVSLAAQALGVEEARIAKTLAFRKKDGSTLLVCTAGDTKVDNKCYKAEFGMKARMLSGEEALLETGFAIGGVCPFVKAEHIDIVLDRSLERFDTIYPAAGDSTSAVILSCEELEKVTGGRWATVCTVLQ